MSSSYSISVSAENLTQIIQDGLGKKITDDIVHQVYRQVQENLKESDIKNTIRAMVECVTTNYLKASTGIHENPQTGQVIINITLHDSSVG